jgi:hypothetical protein
LIDSVEKGYGLVTATHQINEYSEERGIPEVGLSTTRITMNQLGPVIRKVKRRNQGNINPDSPWAKARLRWVTQLLLILGKHKLCPAARENKYLELTITPKYLYNGELEPLSVYQIAFFDECHKKAEIGRMGDTVYSFPRNEGGLYDKDGGIGDVDTKLHCKYPKEGRFCFGVSAVELDDGRIEGRRCATFDYSTKNVITVMGGEKLIKEELKRAREVRTEVQWVETRTHLPGRLFENDSVMVLDKVAGKAAERLSKHGIKTLLDMKMIHASEISAIMADKNFRVSENTLRDWRAKAEQENRGSTPVKLLPLPHPPRARPHGRTDARTNPSTQRATQVRSLLARVYAVSIQNQITTTVP